MLILISNDDGYTAPGLLALADAVRSFAQVVIVAPELNQSGASNSITLNRPLIMREHGVDFYYLQGTPADCVHVALTSDLLPRRPDLVISGINNGQNMGNDTLYSGTVAAATEAFQFGVSAMAFSLAHKGWHHLQTAQRIATQLVQSYQTTCFNEPILLNVNVPNLEYEQLQGIETTRLGSRHPSPGVSTIQTPQGEAAYWIGQVGRPNDESVGTDFWAIERSCVSVTPLRFEHTYYEQLDSVSDWLNDVCVKK